MRLLCISEYAARGSGYTTILRGLLGEWERRGHHIVTLAFDYDGSEHPHASAIVPTDPSKIGGQWLHVRAGFRPEIIVVIFDLSLHHTLRALQNGGVPYIGVFPIESDPLIHPSEWTNTVDMMAAALCESRFGTELLNAQGIRARWLPIGIDPFWRPPTTDEREAARAAWNVADRFVVLTVADNQERKNLPAHFAAITLLRGGRLEWPPLSGHRRQLSRGQTAENAYWVLNTKRRPKQLGHTIFELSQRFGLQGHCLILEHERDGGLEPERLRELYWVADACLLLSKAEGLGLPVLEAMATGVPVVGTDCTGIAESLGGGTHGLLVGAEYVHIDPFHNQYRRWADPLQAAGHLAAIARRRPDRLIRNALEYAGRLTWERAGDIFEEVLNGLVTGGTEAEEPVQTREGTASETATDADAAAIGQTVGLER